MEIIKREFLPRYTTSVHAPTIEKFNDHFVFAWFGGTREGDEDSSIFVYNLNNDQKVISVGTKDRIPRWNPILFNYDNRIWMFEKFGMFCDQWQTMVHDMTKWDNGIIEKEIMKTGQCLHAGLNGPVKTRPLSGKFIIDGKKANVICGSSVETFYDWTSYMEYYNFNRGKIEFVGRSNPLSIDSKSSYIDPYGRTRTVKGIIQPSLFIHENKAYALMRSCYGLGKIYLSCETEGGWCSPFKTNIYNPNSGICVVSCGGDIYLCHNPSNKNRYPLYLSRIGIQNKDLIIYESLQIEGQCSGDGCISNELSYPYMIVDGDKIHLVYTYGRSKIEYVQIYLYNARKSSIEGLKACL